MAPLAPEYRKEAKLRQQGWGVSRETFAHDWRTSSVKGHPAVNRDGRGAAMRGASRVDWHRIILGREGCQDAVVDSEVRVQRGSPAWESSEVGL